jgi:membrane-bound metal-dependent hydrolase YbcI (DUF457 family)
MFIGHFAIGFASKRLAPRTSLATLVVAPLFSDILFPLFMLAGIEHARIEPGATRVTPMDLYDYPWSHSLLMTMVWAIVFGGAYFAFRRDRTASLVLAGGVLSHFVLDWITHRPDVQLYPGSSTRVGLGLWYSLPGTLAVEATMFAAAVALYVTVTKARDRQGSIGLWAFIAFLVVVYLGSVLGPPPPSLAPVIVVGVASNLLFFWIAWFDRHRETIAR